MGSRHPRPILPNPGDKQLDVARLPILMPSEIGRVLMEMGFFDVRQRGSHKHYNHSDGRGTTVPFHGSRGISPFLLRQIIKDIAVTAEEFLGHL